ncbi:MAG: hypothetical protein ACXWZF_04435 [Actinomycetota bacterium]
MLDGTLGQGQKTLTRFTLRPASTENDRVYQFVVVGVSNGGDPHRGEGDMGDEREVRRSSADAGVHAPSGRYADR